MSQARPRVPCSLESIHTCSCTHSSSHGPPQAERPKHFSPGKRGMTSCTSTNSGIERTQRLNCVSRCQRAPSPPLVEPRVSTTFAFEWRKGMIFVPVRINGSKPFSFVLDSGSTRIVIDRVLASDLGLKANGTGSLQGAGAGRIPIEFIHDVRIGLPGVEDGGYELSTADLQPLESSLGVRVDGILGYELFQRFVITIDYEKKTLTFTLPGAFRPSEDAQVLPIELRDKWPFVKAELVLPGPVTIQDSFMIDSGSSDAVDHPIVMKIQSRG